MQRTDAIATLMSAGYDPMSAGSMLDRAQASGAAIARGFRIQYSEERGYRVDRPRRRDAQSGRTRARR